MASEARPAQQTVRPLIERLNQLFVDLGFARLTVADMARSLNCSKRALYELAPSKSALVRKVIEYNFSVRLEESRQAVYTHIDPPARLHAYFALVNTRNRQRSGRFFEDIVADETLNAVRLQYIRASLELVELTVQDGIDQGVFRSLDPQLMTEIFLGVVKTLSRPLLPANSQVDYNALFGHAVEILQYGVLSPGRQAQDLSIIVTPEPDQSDGGTLIDRVEHLFETEGFAHLTVSDLARRLSCSKRALYSLAKSKHALIERVTQRNYDRHYLATKAAVYRQDNPVSRMIAYFTVIHNRNEQHADQFVIDVRNQPGAHSIRVAHVQQMMNLLENILRDGIARGDFRDYDPALSSATALGMLNGVDALYAAPLDVSHTHVFDNAVNLFLHGILLSSQG